MTTKDFSEPWAWKVRKEGNILDRWDKEDERGCHTGFFIEYEGWEYLLRMTNGNITRLRALWEIED